MSALTARTLTTEEETAAVDTIVLACAADPMARWSWPDAHTYVTYMPSLVRAFGGRACRHCGAHATDGFESLGTIQVGSSPPMVPMLRAPRSPERS